ncbi:unnamed protein product [Lactuca saligna]|uniref:Uncharacterized protein n=1 Tax=Lactuca saligna TaxID=75948 RepID=A0AA35Z848_LACSI|nr:unnamed protein product [Lactuca saligna]
MRNTRTTSFKSKFTNTKETVLNLDEDDDDFVSPPIEGVGSETNDIKIVGSSKTKKQRKTNSRSEHGKNNVDYGKSDCLVSRKQLWRRDDKTCYYRGPILVLTKLEISAGGFGRQLLEKFEDIVDDDGMVHEDEMLDGILRDYGAEEAYVAVIEHRYGVILSEKKNIEKAPKHGIEKFPDSLMLKEWCEKNKELFKEVNNADAGGMKYNEASFDGDSNKGEADGGKEEGLSPSTIGNSWRKE